MATFDRLRAFRHREGGSAFAFVLAARLARLMDDDAREARKRRREALPNEAREDLARGIFETWNFVQVPMVEGIVERFPRLLDDREVANPARIHVDVSADDDLDFVRMAVQTGALMGFGDARKPVRRFEAELLNDASTHGARIAAAGSLGESSSTRVDRGHITRTLRCRAGWCTPGAPEPYHVSANLEEVPQALPQPLRSLQGEAKGERQGTPFARVPDRLSIAGNRIPSSRAPRSSRPGARWRFRGPLAVPRPVVASRRFFSPASASGSSAGAPCGGLHWRAKGVATCVAVSSEPPVS